MDNSMIMSYFSSIFKPKYKIKDYTKSKKLPQFANYSYSFVVCKAKCEYILYREKMVLTISNQDDIYTFEIIKKDYSINVLLNGKQIENFDLSFTDKEKIVDEITKINLLTHDSYYDRSIHYQFA